MSNQILQSGTVIDGKYRLDRPIGMGGFSTVYQGAHTGMDRTVAVKIFDPADQDPQKADERAQRFEQEARLVSQLEHPNTVTIHDFGVEPDGKAFLVMEFIEGKTLGELLNQEGPLAQERTIGIFHQILGSLEEAHHRNILHSDLKPANIMLTENFKGEELVKVLDFGIARMIRKHRAGDDSEGSSFMGTPRYASPEQLLMGELSLATDVYGVGMLMWACLVGRPMVPHGEFQDYVAYATSADRWRLPNDVDVEAELAEIVERAVSKSPTDRYRDASAMLDALRACASVEKDDLPEVKANPFTASDGVVDPNVDASEDPENIFLNPDSGDEVARQKEDANRRRARPEVDRDAGFFGESKLELDDVDDSEADEKRPLPSERSAHRQPVRRSPSRDDMSVAEIVRRPRVLVGVGAVVAALAVAIIFVGSEEADVGDDEDVVASSGAGEALDEVDGEGDFDQPVIDSPHSVDGILIAVRSQGWRVDEFREPVELSEYRYHPATAYQGNVQIDLTLFVTYGDEVRLDLENDISFPDQHVTFDHIVVRVSPRDDNAIDAAIELANFLETFRELVREEDRRAAE